MSKPRFGGLVRDLRMKRRISLRALARHMNWSSAYMSDIELNQRRPPNPDKIRRIADFLEADAGQFLELAEQERTSIELRVDRQEPIRMDTGLTLARCWEDLGEDTLREIQTILKNRANRS